MRLPPIIIMDVLYWRSYKSQTPRIKPMAAIISPIFGKMLIKDSITAGVTATTESVIDTTKLCETAVIKSAINGDTRHINIQTSPILLKMVSDFQNVLLFSEMDEQFICSFFKRFILIISKIR